MANSDPDLKWLIITASCQRVAEVNLKSRLLDEESFLEWPPSRDGRSSRGAEQETNRRERKRERGERWGRGGGGGEGARAIAV